MNVFQKMRRDARRDVASMFTLIALFTAPAAFALFLGIKGLLIALALLLVLAWGVAIWHL